MSPGDAVSYALHNPERLPNRRGDHRCPSCGRTFHKPHEECPACGSPVRTPIFA